MTGDAVAARTCCQIPLPIFLHVNYIQYAAYFFVIYIGQYISTRYTVVIDLPTGAKVTFLQVRSLQGWVYNEPWP